MVPVAQWRRWLPFAVATLATVLLAGGFGLAVNQFTAPRHQPAPQLKTVPASTMTRLGITLSAPSQPLYCGVAGAVVGRGWLRSGAAGCAISQSAAESTARQGGSARVVESVLAQVSSSRVAAIGRDMLAWVVVTQQSVRGSCMQGVGGYQVCVGGGRTSFTWNQLVVVDAHSGSIVNQLRVTPAGAGRVRPAFPQPGAILSGG